MCPRVVNGVLVLGQRAFRVTPAIEDLNLERADRGPRAALSHQVLDVVTGLLKKVSVRRPDHPQTDDEDVHGSCRCCLGCHDREPVVLRFQTAFTVASGTGAQDLRRRTRLMRCSASLAGTRAARPGKVIRSGSVKGGFWCDSNRRGCHYF